ncbi:DUF1330 domain-containing protein [Lacisediminimonas sp.]|uniref:DUF1330 domain-containing protein n=1 Tax=Lacisediminimonas sp. TaxID=3060582 RepID=UPI0027216F93|nr:DUF1330 domain-containing protein [Lacisediminimonas sp.]MDO8299745.1 DUF1330 domain-containing protein [Lacisediminimonas sp.]MDO9217442.1 DUF1330 domain-containing protein [Lacisediminimonas sp.]
MKKAYIIAEITVTDPAGYAEYGPMASASVAEHGGRFLVRGGQREQREGADAQHSNALRTVIVEFDSLEKARGWYESVEYTKAIAVRQANSIGRLCIVEGFQP